MYVIFGIQDGIDSYLAVLTHGYKELLFFVYFYFLSEVQLIPIRVKIRKNAITGR